MARTSIDAAPVSAVFTDGATRGRRGGALRDASTGFTIAPLPNLLAELAP
ncbi:hypothetical protein [Nannocystis pusilla]